MATKEPDSGLAALAADHPAVGVAVGVVRKGRIRHFHGRSRR
jgi:hypothetical protein